MRAREHRIRDVQLQERLLAQAQILEEHVDARNWLRYDSAKQVDAISYSKKLSVDGSDPKSDPSVATHTNNGVLDTYTTNRISTHKLFINPTIQAIV